MQPLTALDLATSIARVTVTDLETGAVSYLTTRPDSVCHFFYLFPAGDNLVQLRLDWSDIDPNGHPRLDADFLDPVTRKHVHRKRLQPVHHTDSMPSAERGYRWQFEDVDMHIRVSVYSRVRSLLLTFS